MKKGEKVRKEELQSDYRKIYGVDEYIHYLNCIGFRCNGFIII